MIRGRARTIALLLAIAFVGACSLALYTRLGIFAVGHRYWLWKAAVSESEEARRDSFGRVLGATQYGVNQAEAYVRGIEDRQRRIQLWRTLIDMAPNDNWAGRYARALEAEESPDPKR